MTVTYAPPAAWRTIRYDYQIQHPDQRSWIRATDRQVTEANKINRRYGDRIVGVRYKTRQVPL
jgi:hypothetical protein